MSPAGRRPGRRRGGASLFLPGLVVPGLVGASLASASLASASLASASLAGSSPPGGPSVPPPPASLTVPLGRSAPVTAPDVAYAVTCDGGQRFQGTLGGAGAAAGVGAASHGGLPAGTRCTARLAPTGGLPALTETLPPVPASGVVTVQVTEDVPAIVLSPALGPPGQPTAVSGAGFPPHAAVTLSWNAGQGGAVSVTTDVGGGFTTSDLVLPDSPQGLAQLAAAGTGFPTVIAGYLVVPPSVEPQGDTPIQTVFRP